MRGKFRRFNQLETTHIDMVPMVDCIMVLLIFLMISSAFVSDPAGTTRAARHLPTYGQASTDQPRTAG